MKFKFLLLFLSFCLSFCVTAKASEASTDFSYRIDGDRLYVSPACILFGSTKEPCSENPHAIFLMIDDKIGHVNHLFVDINGIYTDANDFFSTYTRWEKCSRCNQLYDANNNSPHCPHWPILKETPQGMNTNTYILNGWSIDRKEEEDFSYKIVDDRIYIHPTVIGLAYSSPKIDPTSGSHCILIQVEGKLGAINHIFIDEKGIYINKQEAEKSLNPKCTRCHRWFNPNKQYKMCPHTIIKGREGWKFGQAYV